MVFQKKTNSPDQLIGARLSPHHLVKCISSGVPSIDALLLGGGVPLGYSVTVVSDQPRTYSTVLHKFFASEGIESGHVVIVAGKGARLLASDLPTSTDQQEKSAVHDQKLKIAWAYQNQPQVANEPKTGGATRFGHYWDIAVTRDYETIKDNLVLIEPTDFDKAEDFERAVLEAVKMAKDKFPNRVIRLNMLDCGDIMWTKNEKLTRLLLRLRSITADSNVVTLATCAPSLSPVMVPFSDVAFSLENFIVKQSPFQGTYDGLLELSKLIQVGLRPFQPKVSQFGFKLKRKKFFVEALHLPPDFEEVKSSGCSSSSTSACSSSSSSTGNGGCCGSGGTTSKESSLDF